MDRTGGIPHGVGRRNVSLLFPAVSRLFFFFFLGRAAFDLTRFTRSYVACARRPALEEHLARPNNLAEFSQKPTFGIDFTSSSRSVPLTRCGEQLLLTGSPTT